MTVTIHEAKTHLSRLIRKAAQGEEVLIARGHQVVARLSAASDAGTERTPDGAKGLVWVADDFDAPIEAFEDYRA